MPFKPSVLRLENVCLLTCKRTDMLPSLDWVGQSVPRQVQYVYILLESNDKV